MNCRCRRCGTEFNNLLAAAWHGKTKHNLMCSKNDIKRVIKGHVPEDVAGRVKKGLQSVACFASITVKMFVFIVYAVLKGLTLPFHVIYEWLD